ncbi:hypothetical protein EG888_01640 [Listeria monocytogenes]|uniref:Uncharacterized protein n=3 Tax=Listeria monocytogenes TaxID=1639 RepID=A0A9P1YE41_LISMN|nr:hypothetical protein [Listeria monocytogenes]EAA0165811.1 hypothetical protein [Listeria monocytogenes serotype 1/2a]EAD3237158.1 hypothetical protein [Listeria monocytogenes CFSAN002202]EAE6021059.1 hypothetical protein [Listeria monocytogenes serotype 3a]EAF4500325.1 hypothetical protein [Listeria monocytogenes serotype 4b]EAG6256697.1 hypothetical protein [Listeria monocytogenes CFSAN003807]EAG6269782.1 hypothetical protein [Listeria monocytogenes CFSAN003726]EAG6274621.1 hypothetical 
MISILQILLEPEFISLTVTFLLMLTIFSYWSAITLLKPKMVLPADAICLKPVKISLRAHFYRTSPNFVINWLAITRKCSAITDDEDSFSFSNV